ncbi:MAG: hypothetical protein KatS3mg111_2452 [Pirellulaceae bacterium]|nr:MAG: hypothetical protein KatS3mg111_2452 [Pirellulaceae bacterium]
MRAALAVFYFRVLGELPYGLTADIAEALRTPDAQRTSSQRRLLRQHYRRQHWEQWDAWERRRQQLQEQLDGIAKQAVRVMVMDDLPERRPTFVLHRGDYQKPLQEVHAGTPAVLPPLPDGPEPARLRLAKWLISPHNPLTARVIVNRHWQMFFGRGLVETAEDFGSQGQRPSHPELLDWLATRLIESGWDIKQLHRDIVLSSAYRQSASVPAEAGELDPENRWWMRGPRYRLPSWMLRDQALAAAGLLSSRFGGPPVKPYQPDGLWAEATFGKIRYQRDTGEALYRRSLYVFWRRIVGPPMFFDAAKRQTCEVRPTRTNTPLQALTEMNETAMVECARAMAQRCLIEGGKTDEERLRYAFRLVTSRWPRREETEILRRRLEDSRRRFQQQPEEARQLLAVGESSRVELGDPIDHAALTVVCNLLLNLDEVLTRE